MPCPATEGATSLGPSSCPGGGQGCWASVLPCPSRPRNQLRSAPRWGWSPSRTLSLPGGPSRAPAAAHPAPLPLHPRKARQRLVETLYCAGGGVERQPLLKEDWAAGTAITAWLQLRPRWGGARAPPAPPCPGWAGPPGSAGRWAAVVQAAPDHLGQDLCALVCGREQVLRKRPAPPPHLPGAEVLDPSLRGQAPPLPVTPSSLPWPSCCGSSARGVSLGASRTPPNPSLGRGSFCPCSAGRPGDGAHLTWAAGRPGWGSGPLWMPAPASSGRLQETALGPGLRAGAP